ncbi:MAG: hypothetical protein SOX77_04935 [Candidatus Borkfalkiaceae bacterium]|nr:hypothetical protein [Christensenellaceae bacterium]
MAVPIIPILKKIGAAVLSNKKGRKTVLYLILIVTIIVMLPAIAVMGIFSNDVRIDTSEIESIMQEREKIEAERHAEIEQAMTEAGYSEIKIREAQAIYSFALFNLSGDDVAEKLTECFLAETDEELAEKINGAFYTAFSVDEISAILESVRQEYESERSEKA